MRRTQRGFTLIEMLVALTLYALALAALIGGLRSGTRAWSTIRDHQRDEAAVARAVDALRTDIRHLAIVDDETPALVEETLDSGGDGLTLTRLVGRDRPWSGVWERITYRVEDSDERGPGLTRTVRPAVSAPLELPGEQFPLLHSVREMQVSYVSDAETVTEWENAESLPSRIDIRLVREGAPDVDISIAVPLGVLNGRAAP